MGDSVALKLTTQGYDYPIAVSCAPPPAAPADPTAVHLVCQVTAFNKRRPSKSPAWVEDVTCNLLVPPGTPGAARAAATRSSKRRSGGPPPTLPLRMSTG